MQGTHPLPTGLPPGSEVQRIVFSTQPPGAGQALFAFPPAIRRWAMIAPQGSEPETRAGEQGLLLLYAPLSPTESSDAEQEAEFASKISAWVEAAAAERGGPNQSMTFQGAQIFWNQGSLAVRVQPERYSAVRAALVEAFYYEAELRQIEQEIGVAWPQLEGDVPLAFQFSQNSLGKRRELRARFQQVLMLRARLARLHPHVHAPHMHPPTLAAQIGERLRERTRMVPRYEALSEQLEVFEDVYHMCSERVDNFMLTRSSNALEWMIIILLLAQILLSGVEILVGTGP